MAFVRLDHVSVTFPIFTSHTRSLRAEVFSRLGGRIQTHNRTAQVQALRDVCLDLRDGDRLGLVGHNGAGKTTFLRVVGGVYPPTVGHAHVSGRVSSLTDLTLGMDLESTGWQNILFRCVFLGMTFREAREIAPSIGEYSELGEFLDLPVRTYSSGMFLRLAFAISTAVQPDIVIMDEMISAGDAAFLEKAKRRIEELLSKARIFILASHSDEILRRFCNRGLLLEHGSIKLAGDIETVIEASEAERRASVMRLAAD